MALTKITTVIKDCITSKFITGFVLLFAILYFFLAHEGIYYSDDLSYSDFASRILKGTFDITQNGHTFIHRPAVFIPTAVFYYLFGINQISYSLWPLLCTIACIYLVYKFADQENLNSAFAAVLIGLNFYFIYFINILYPDNIVAFFVLAAAIVYNQLRKGKQNLNSNVFVKALLFVSFLFIAGLAKETAIIVLPYFIFYCVKDLVDSERPRRSFWVYSILISVVLIVGYFAWYYIETGDAFYRINEMERANNGYDNYVTNSGKSYLNRLVWGPLGALTGTGSLILLIFALGGNNTLKKDSFLEKQYWFWLFITAYLILSFSSTSLRIYNPVQLDARMFNLLLPPLAIAASYGFQDKLFNLRFTASYSLAFLVVAIYLQDKLSLVYGLLAFYFALHTAILYLKPHYKEYLLRVAMAAILIALLIRPAYFALKDKTLYYPEHQEVMKVVTERVKTEGLIVAILPDYLFHGSTYFLKYKPVQKLTLTPYSETDTTDLVAGKLLLINRNLNTTTSFHQKSGYTKLIEMAKKGKLIWEKHPLQLYEL
ncbi:ArnT family glycosyltransferase [Pontibacter fetidus]|uniref:Glycosyltransferase RgtA/B/C/D-like domain-containing protein n=1 Tax=Pontibacter fetidus TaxID=2700082 RepID=A0A6B2GX00_9BACT|nr:hypothetical protein [Pontibacter fetidus]NDK54503.1 hypothetical protein [Pontibacter fetidus]